MTQPVLRALRAVLMIGAFLLILSGLAAIPEIVEQWIQGATRIRLGEYTTVTDFAIHNPRSIFALALGIVKIRFAVAVLRLRSSLSLDSDQPDKLTVNPAFYSVGAIAALWFGILFLFWAVSVLVYVPSLVISITEYVRFQPHGTGSGGLNMVIFTLEQSVQLLLSGAIYVCIAVTLFKLRRVLLDAAADERHGTLTEASS